MTKTIVVGAVVHGKSVAGSTYLQPEYQIGGFIDNVYPAVADVWSFPAL